MTRRLGGSDIAVSALGLGCAPLGNLYTAVDDATARATVDAAVDEGVRLFDTAPHYGLGLSEQRLGDALDRVIPARLRRDQLVVSTKVGRVLEPVDGPPWPTDDEGFDVPATVRRRVDFSAEGVRRSLEASLERLGLDRVDVVLLHDPDDHLEAAIAQAHPVLAAMREAGVVGAIGAGMNHWRPLEQLVARCDLDVVLLAGRYSLLDQGAAQGLLATCLRRTTSVLVAGVFNSGILATDRPGPDARYDYAPAPPQVLARVRAIADVCERHGATVPQAALHLPLAHPAVAGIVVGARSPAEVRRNADLLRRPVPPGVWADLRREGLLPPDIPVPGG